MSSPRLGLTDTDWWKAAVVYQIYPRSFADSDGDGIGDLPGILAHVDHLARLGVDVVWLSPVYPSPQDDAGYDISDYQNIDPVFGTLADFDDILAALHERGIKLVMDLVVNHTSDEHPWFAESRSSRDNPKRDWYWWRPAREGFSPGEPGAEPNNWSSAFSGSAWELDPTTGEYFLHIFSKKQPDLNWENPDVRAAVHQMMRWWLDRGVDGFRMDVINFISKDPALPDGHVLPGTAFRAGSEHYLNGPRIHEFLREMHDAVFSDRDGAFLTVGEMPGCTVEQARMYTDPRRHEVDMVFQFEHVNLDQGPGGKWDLRPFVLADLKQTMNRWQVGLQDIGWNSLYWDNHDQPRAVSRYGDDGRFRVRSAKLLLAVLHLHHGTPYVYQGDEIGMTNYPFTGIDQFRDIESLNYFAEAVGGGATKEDTLRRLRAKSRDNARTPMQWDDGRNAGFTTGTPWLGVNPNHDSVNVAAAEADPESVLHFLRELIRLRHSEPVVAFGDFAMMHADQDSIYAFVRSYEDAQLLVAGNWSGEPASIDLGNWASARCVLSNVPDPTGAALQPWEVRVYRR